MNLNRIINGQNVTDTYASTGAGAATLDDVQRFGAIFTVAASPYSSVYYPSVMRVAGLLADPLDDWYMWYSTDHDGSAGGIALATAPQITGPWTSRGQVFVDTTTGNQTETPAVVYRHGAAQPFWLYYHQNNLGNNQSTALAKSADGRSFTRHGMVIDVPTVEYPGQSHTGYFHARDVGGGLICGHHVIGGGAYSHYGISWSRDGERFVTDPRPLYPLHNVASSDNFIPQVITRYDGRWWSFGTFVVGAVGHVAVAPLGDDLRSILAPARILLSPTEAYDGSTIRSFTTVEDEGSVHVVYTTDTGNICLARVF